MNDVLLGLGSNVGDSRAFLRQAIDRLQLQGRVVGVSRIWRSEPVGYADQDWFSNMTLIWRTELGPSEALESIRIIESSMGRQRDIPNGPRTIDLDILLWNDLVHDEPDLTIPHPRMHQRRFVLGPAAEITPSRVHPVLHRTMRELLDDLEDPARAEPED